MSSSSALPAVLTIIGMALVTFVTRISGFFSLQYFRSPVIKQVLELAPGCILISLTAPYFVTGNFSDLGVLLLAAVLAVKTSMLKTLLISLAVSFLIQLAF